MSVYAAHSYQLTGETCRIKAKLKSGEMYVRGDQWPLFLNEDNKFDTENPWEGLLCSQLMVLVSCHLMPTTGRSLNP